MKLYRYVVNAERRVSEPGYGPDAYSVATYSMSFPFGKKTDVKTGKEAEASAREFAKTILDHASSVSIFRMEGSCGMGEYIKRDDTLFCSGWEGVNLTPAIPAD